MIVMPKVPTTSQAHRSSSLSSAAVAGGATTRNTPSWTQQDDETLIRARASGLNWNAIAPKYFKSKTPNACRKRHERLMEKRNAEEWDGVKLEVLAAAYMDKREQIWRILAEAVGEKQWQVVEAKCMEKGVKNLQQVHRAMQKKQGTEHHDDSGISCSDPKDELDDHHVDRYTVYSHAPAASNPQQTPTIQSLLNSSQQYPSSYSHS